MELVSIDQPLQFYGRNNIKMETLDYYTLATKVSVSKLKEEMIQYQRELDFDMFIESFPLMKIRNMIDGKRTNSQNILKLFLSSSKDSYEKMPIPLINSTTLFDIIRFEIFPQHRQNNQKPFWVKITNDAYDLFLYIHFKLCNTCLETHLYEEIKTCSLFFYLESIFIKVASSFAKTVIIEEYTKYTSFSYVDELFSGKVSKKEPEFINHFAYEKITGRSPLEVLKFFKNDEIYVTYNTDIIKEGLIGILIFGDDITNVHKAYKKYNNELKAQQWLNKGITKLKLEKIKEWKNRRERDVMCEDKISLSCLSFNISTIVSYKGFRMFVFPIPLFPTVQTKLSEVTGNLKFELKMIEKLIPTYELFKQEKKDSPFFLQYHSTNHYVFYNVSSMMKKSTKRTFALFENVKNMPSKNHIYNTCNASKYFCNNFVSTFQEISLYEEPSEEHQKKKDFNKTVDVHLQKVVKEIESLFSEVPFDTISLKSFLHNRGIRISMIGRMLKFVTFSWLHSILCNEILLRCTKHFIFSSIREICLFYKKNVKSYLLNEHQKYGVQFSSQKKKFLKHVSSIQVDDTISKDRDETISDTHGTEQTSNTRKYTLVTGESLLLRGKYNGTWENYKNHMNKNPSEENQFGDENGTSDSDDDDDDESETEKTETSEDELFIPKFYELQEKLNKKGLSSKKIALQSFLNMHKILKKKMILESYLSCDFALASKLLNFDRFKKYTNTEMYRLKGVRMDSLIGLHNFDVIKKKYHGNITIIDMFTVNVFNLLLIPNNYTEIFFSSVIQKICSTLFKIENFTPSMDIHYNYLYKNLQSCLGISFYPCLREYNQRRESGRRMELHHLKTYGIHVKRSIHVGYLDLPLFKYTEDSDLILLDTDQKNKQILSHLIMFTILFHHHLNMSSTLNLEQLALYEQDIKNSKKDMASKNTTGVSCKSMKSNKKTSDFKKYHTSYESKNELWKKNIDRLKKKNLEIHKSFYHEDRGNENFDSEDYITLSSDLKTDWIYKIKINPLLISKDFITNYSETNYFTFYSLLNLIAVGIKFHLFNSALHYSHFAFRYISDDSILSIHFRLMWLFVYACKKHYSQYIRDNPKGSHTKNRIITNFFSSQQSDNHTNGQVIGEIKKEYEGAKDIIHDQNIKKMPIMDNTSILGGYGCGEYDFVNTTSDPKNLSYKNSSYEDYYNEKKLKENDSFFHSGKTDVYKKTFYTCSTILNDYFSYLHPFHLDFFLSLAWCNKSATEYREFLYLLRKIILLQINMCLKSSNCYKMQNIKLNDDFDSIIFFNLNESKLEDHLIREEEQCPSYFLVHDICYPHDTLFLQDNILCVKRRNSIYNIRLAYTLHYFATSLFYYYSTNRIIRKYKSEDFLLNSFYNCIKILEHVKMILRFFDTRHMRIAKVSMDLSLIVLKIVFSENFPQMNRNKLMLYALAQTKNADEILRYNVGINHIETLYCNYLLGLIYMHLDQKDCIYSFEEVYYYLTNYNYIYHDKNIISDIFWYLPEHTVTLRCVKGKGFLDKDNIKCYLLKIYLNLLIPMKYLKKLMKIVLLLYSTELMKNKKNADMFQKNAEINDINSYSCEKILEFLRSYQHIMSPEILFTNIQDYDELLQKNKQIQKKEIQKPIKKNMQEIDIPYKKRNKESSYEEYDFIPYEVKKNDSDIKQEEMNNEPTIGVTTLEEIMKDSGNENTFEIILRRNTEKINKYRSVTASFLKHLIKIVEYKAKFLYNEEKNLHDVNKHINMKQNNLFLKVMKATKHMQLKKLTDVNAKYSTRCGNIMLLDNSTIDTVSLFNSEYNGSEGTEGSFVTSESEEGTEHARSNSFIDSVTKKVDKKDRKNKKKSMHKRNGMSKSQKNKKSTTFYTDINTFLSILYYFLNNKTFERVYMELKK